MDSARLIELIKSKSSCAVAFSGGVDSSVVAAAAFRALGKKAVAVTVVSELFPDDEAAYAAGIARGIGIRHRVVRVSILDNEKVASNPQDRCYHCKSDDFGAIRAVAREEGLSVILDGTNADDTRVRRPGLKALVELGIISPLMKLGLTKIQVRALARQFGLPNSEKPANPCLASRFPYGIRLTPAGLARVGEAERYIKSLGFEVLRVRDHDCLARIEVEPSELLRLMDEKTRKKIVDKLLSLGYNYVSVDMVGFRTGSMDEILKQG